MIKIVDIHKNYADNEVLKGVNIEINTGTIQALLGANGSGKSTLVHIISGLLQAKQGDFFIDDEKITIDSCNYRSKVGYVFETPIFIDFFSATEYLSFVSKMHKISENIYKERIKELIDLFELPKNAKRISDYSKGMQNKVSLAAAIIHKPSYLILDEPFSGLDFVSVQNITRLFKEMAAKGLTILITSHQYDVVASLCDNFALLKEGEIIFNHPMLELEKHAKQKYENEKDPVKTYLDNLMTTKEYKGLSWT